MNTPEPTERELEQFIDYWLYNKQKKMGFEFVSEAFIEATDTRYADLFAAYRSADSTQIGIAVKQLVNDYWRPMAERDALEHDFEEDRREMYQMEKNG